MIRFLKYYPLGPMGYTVWGIRIKRVVLGFSLKYVFVYARGHTYSLFFWPPGMHVE